MTAIEFLNIASYIKDREKRDRKALEDWKRKN